LQDLGGEDLFSDFMPTIEPVADDTINSVANNVDDLASSFESIELKNMHPDRAVNKDQSIRK
uniref:Vps53_N domain-containing protein n=1 Tax=Gongylonema pulchrum TaxID=637853 RepID=A0A183D8A5_9BILA